MSLLQSWRWFGPNDPVVLQDIIQAGATGIVSALHQVPHGEIWKADQIAERKKIIEDAGLKWVVVESLPVHEQIKTRGPECEKYLDNYRQSLRNIASCGIKTVCYNFMPVLDWTRTSIDLELRSKALALQFTWDDLAIFDLHILKRSNARKDYQADVIGRAEEKVKNCSAAELDRLSDNILMGVPTEGASTLADLSKSISIYREIGHAGLRENLVYFLESIRETCEEVGVSMTIHPDDPPYPILGLPRIASNLEDLLFIINSVNHPFNGICFCTGSLGAGLQNDVPEILKAVSNRVYFAHLRNVKKDHYGNFYESDHLDGDVDMYEVVKELLRIQKENSVVIPFRPDHGHQMLDDLHKKSNPGYSAIGRLKGLAEIRGLELGVKRAMLI